MPETSNNVLTVIVAVVIVLVLLAVFLLAILIYFHNRKLRSMREQDDMKKQFQQVLTRTQLEVQEQTMRQISQEIHDNVGQVLSLVNLNLQTMNSFDQEKISHTSQLVNKAIGDLRVLSRNLNPEYVARQGLLDVLKQELARLEKTGRFRTELVVDDEPVLSPDKLLILYRMVQEVLNNIIKHADADVILTTVSPGMVRISDNGRGFDAAGQSPGLGLQHLQQRAQAIGAGMQVDSRPGKGTIVTFILDKT